MDVPKKYSIYLTDIEVQKLITGAAILNELEKDPLFRFEMNRERQLAEIERNLRRKYYFLN